MTYCGVVAAGLVTLLCGPSGFLDYSQERRQHFGLYPNIEFSGFMRCFCGPLRRAVGHLLEILSSRRFRSP